MNNDLRRPGRAHTLIYNSILLCLSSILMRAVSVSFNVYISNLVGAEVMGLYSLINSVFGFALTLATSGINLAATRCVAEAAERSGETRAAMRRALLMAGGFGIFSSLLLAAFSGTISRYWLKDPRTLIPLRLMAISLPAISISSALGGYFSAVRRVWKSAATQLAEQALKIYATSTLLTLFLPRGAEYACVALVLGCAISDLVSCVISYTLYLRDRKKLTHTPCPAPIERKMTRKLFGIALPVAFSAYVRSGLTTVEHILIPLGLQSFGLERGEALASYGVLTGMVLPVVLFPYAIIYSFTGLLVPEIAGAASENHRRRITYITSRVWRLTITLGTACAGIMAVCSEELGMVLYGSEDAAKFILSLAPLLPIMYLDTVTDSLLKGLGKQVYTMNVNIADAALSVILVRLLLPSFGIYGYVAVLYISELVNFAFSATRLLRLTKVRIKVVSWILLPLICVIAASNLCCYLFGLLNLSLLPGWLSLTVHIIILLVIFLAMMRITGSLDKEYCRWLMSSLRPDIKKKSEIKIKKKSENNGEIVDSTIQKSC